MSSKIVYAFFDKGECFYIGIGTLRRFNETDSKRRNLFTYRKIQKAKQKNTFNKVILHSNLNWKTACWYEKMYIQAIGRRDLGLGPLTNLTDGGELNSNVSDITRNKLSKIHKGKSYCKGIKKSMEACENLSKIRKGKTLTKEHKRKIKESSYKGPTAISIKISTPYGVFRSIRQAGLSDKVPFSLKQVYTRVKNKKYKEWKYVDEPREVFNVHTPRGIFPSYRKAAKANNYSPQYLKKKCLSDECPEYFIVLT